MNIRDLLKPDAWYCQKCAGPLTFHAEGSQSYSCERCQMMWPAENIVLFGYADLTDESFIDSRASVAAPQGDVNQRRMDIALSYIKRAANRELPKMPCRVDEMTEREVAIFKVCAAATGNLQFIARELDAMDSWLPSPVSPSQKVEEVEAGEQCALCDEMMKRPWNEKAGREVLHSFHAATPIPPSDAARKAAEEIVQQFDLEKPGWVTLGRITIDRETETEKFERTSETATDRITAIISRYLPVPVEEGDEHPPLSLSPNDLNDLCETLEMAAGDLDTEGLGDTDSCIFARKWITRLRGETEVTT